jgi:hypothetical protein
MLDFILGLFSDDGDNGGLFSSAADSEIMIVIWNSFFKR